MILVIISLVPNLKTEIKIKKNNRTKLDKINANLAKTNNPTLTYLKGKEILSQ